MFMCHSTCVQCCALCLVIVYFMVEFGAFADGLSCDCELAVSGMYAVCPETIRYTGFWGTQ